MTNKNDVVLYLKFWSDHNYAHFMESLDMRHPSNQFAEDSEGSGVAFLTEPSHQLVVFAKQLGATEEPPEDFE